MIDGVPPNRENVTPAIPTRSLRDRLAWAVPLFVICTACLLLRTQSLRQVVFPVEGVVNLQDNDPWYHLRLLDHQIPNLPHRLAHDPFLIHPGGGGVPVGPFFDLSLAAVLRLFAGASPAQHTIETAAAYYPPILAVLVCIVTYFAGATIFNRLAGLIAAAMIAVIPGPFFIRSSLGFYDHHVMEVLLSLVVMLLLAIALRSTNAPKLSPTRTMTFALAAGLALGCYLITWIGGSFLLLILIAWCIVQHSSDHIAGRSVMRLAYIMGPTFAVPLAIVFPFRDVSMARLQIIGLIAGLGLLIVLGALSALLTRLKVRRLYYPVTIAALAIGFMVVIRLVSPEFFMRLASEFGRFAPDKTVSTITEARPILLDMHGFTLKPLWEMFTTTFPMALIVVAALTWRFVRGQDAPRNLLLVWSAIVLLAMFGQSRFAYYAAPIVALLVGHFCQGIIAWCWRVKRVADAKRPSPPGVARWSATALVAAVLLAAAFIPGLYQLPKSMSYYDGPSEDWCEVLTWLRDNSPQPYGDAAYVRPCASASEFERDFDAKSAYGVMSWWDYGYWINAIARRIPNSNPTQAGAADSARFFLAQDEQAACDILNRLGARYVIMDWLLPRWSKPGSGKVSGKFAAMPLWIGDSPRTYYERVIMTEPNGRRVTRFIYFPSYYRTMCARLFVFSGLRIAGPRESTVYLLGRRNNDGLRAVLGTQKFNRLDEAMTFINAATDGSRVLAGESPFVPCVPLEPLTRFRLIHQSPRTAATIARQPISKVRLFEYLPN